MEPIHSFCTPPPNGWTPSLILSPPPTKWLHLSGRLAPLRRPGTASESRESAVHRAASTGARSPGPPPTRTLAAPQAKGWARGLDTLDLVVVPPPPPPVFFFFLFFCWGGRGCLGVLGVHFICARLEDWLCSGPKAEVGGPTRGFNTRWAAVNFRWIRRQLTRGSDRAMGSGLNRTGGSQRGGRSCGARGTQRGGATTIGRQSGGAGGGGVSVPQEAVLGWGWGQLWVGLAGSWALAWSPWF